MLTSKRFVLVVGDSKAGKSRTAYEATTRLRQSSRLLDPRVLVPKSTDLLEQLLVELDPPLGLHPEPALLWLDDLTESALAALTRALFDRLTGQMIVLGTLTAQRHDRIMNIDSDIGRNARQAIASGRADYAPKAAFNLGALLYEQGNGEGAKAAYQQAITSGHAEAAKNLELLKSTPPPAAS